MSNISIGQNEDRLRERGNFIVVPQPDRDFNITIEEMKEIVKKPLEERVRIISEREFGKYVEVLVDSAIRYERPSDPYCKLQETLWQKQKEMPLQERATSTKENFLRVLFTNKQPKKPADEAGYQVNLWRQLPLDTIAKQRAQVYLSPKPYAHLLCRNDILHPIEKKALHEKYTKEFCKKLLSQEVNDAKGQKQWKEQFYDHNPLNYSADLPVSLNGAARDYNKLQSVSLHSPHCPGTTLQKYLQDNLKRTIVWEEQEKEKALLWEKSKYRMALNSQQQETDCEKKESRLIQFTRTMSRVLRAIIKKKSKFFKRNATSILNSSTKSFTSGTTKLPERFSCVLKKR